MEIQKLLENLGENKESIVKEAVKCKSVEEILVLASRNNMSISEEEAKEIFAKLQPKSGALSDDELDAVSGGSDKGPSCWDMDVIV
ncbi:hypothetical protein JMF89_07155 [Clostridiaceae bacterium UIB06]|uniref:Nif11 domain-containing protein n=1 Tax=Clostridium thailandense TaxID=2794346 RepID=A0A949TVY4_9CLOT|nr:hypothetical protein [Clostridium thailandense]MBV7272455.1 hypothetical protein [Clostridium thailandense]MCH5136979.1 hypothetical protein [Clostridiaceae bacterium UIB06]